MSLLNLEGVYENELAVSGEFNPKAPRTVLVLPSGQRVIVPTELLLDTSTLPAGTRTETPVMQQAIPSSSPSVHTQQDVQDTVIPLVEEQLEVGKRAVETGRIHVRRVTEEHVQTVTVPLTEVHWEVEHIPVEQRIDAQPEIRQVGETFIFPLVEERMAVVRELWLREEVHVRRAKTVTEKSADFAVKRDIIVQERS